ncbi:hypothetical protein AMJ39_05635 [candidate division TA06 bacterium DG_24]|uniref:CPBP family intramembrane metalloprotease n=2 Tax=Bacteria division TA06 TaxID=1156500 RepID=A0A0S8JMF7_UNCT6|nr:MAG: hypothetical protein AMJ39_05635 [candidate division TA06 bacterium DG_24]KPL10688.1 MAG: hypothetical protein AMJ71_02320 [candidate division TA06 bacterium SM1_40]
MFRKPVVWVVFVLLAIGSVIFAVRYFAVAYPIVTLDLDMNREMALESSGELARQHGWGPEGFRQAASFQLDSRVQNFVELEAGGTDAFRQLIAEGLYVPYTWRVRLFKEGETNETLVRFTPNGEPYGFVETLPEDEPGATLPGDSARAVAEMTAREWWQIDLAAYEMVEESQEVRPGGRIDHTFVYERSDVQIGEGRYRLRLVVGGDRLTELTHFVKIPEAFSRRYEEMRSANNTISAVSLLATAILYVLGGCVIGLLLLLRGRWVVWRQPLLWGLFIAFLHVLVVINYWPLAWMNYDTALSSQGFWLQRIARLLINFIGFAALLTVVFMAAESLSRKAFPHHVRLWRSWSPGVANSPTVLGQTTGGLLMVALFGAFDVALYAFANRALGWWTPSATLFEPDVLATHFPWLTSVAISLRAGFLEECLFRAIPIAGAALIGQRLGHRRAWIIGAFIVQALIFGTGHANYPQQPAYARVVELIIPSLAFGAIYLYFGLVPAIISHFAIDVGYIGLPLFVSSAPGVWIDKALVVILTLVPLWVIIGARLRRGEWSRLKEEDYNRSWQPPAREEPVPVEAKPVELPALSPRAIRLLLVGGAVGLVIWFFASDFQNYAPSLTVGRSGAKELARETLAGRGIELAESWQALSHVQAQPDQEDRFVWQTGGREDYAALMGSYLTPPRWRVRYVRFEGDVEERAEEYRVFIVGEGEVTRFRHQLPEARAGATLPEDEARGMAHAVLAETYGLDAGMLKEVSSVPSKLPARTDWLFTFADTLSYLLEEGEARLAVEIAGSEVVDSYRYVHVPEEWARQERNQRNVTRLVVQTLCTTLMIVVIAAGVGSAIVGWSRRTFSVGDFVTFSVLFFVVAAFGFINDWPSTVAQFSTAQPLSNQAFTALAFFVVMALLLAGGLALVLGFIQKWKREGSPVRGPGGLWLGFSVGALIAGIQALVMRFEPSLEPFWAEYGALGSYIPIIGSAIEPLGQFVLVTVFFLLIFTVVDRSTEGWSRRRIPFAIVLIFAALVMAGRSADSVPFWLVSGIVSGVVLLFLYVLIFRFQLALVPLAMASVAILGMLRQGIVNAHPAAIPGAILAILLTIALSVYWYRRLSTE